MAFSEVLLISIQFFMRAFEKLKIIGLPIHHIGFNDAITCATFYALNRTPSFICFANVHMTIEAYRNKEFASMLEKADLLLSDGTPLAKAFSWFYNKKQERIAGMDFMPALLHNLNNQSQVFRIFLYGSTSEILSTIETRIKNDYPKLQIVGMLSPPFRKLSNEEQLEINDAINQSGAHVVFVSLGCPKQEEWMATNYKSCNAVLLGVGGAFSVFAKFQKRAPVWMRQFSLEWLYRLLKEPKRLWKRYLITNSIFIYLFIKKTIFPKWD